MSHRARWPSWLVVLLVVAAGCSHHDGKEAAAPPPTSSTTSGPSAAAAGRGPDLGPVLTPADLGGPLPDEGVAVDVEGSGVVLVALGGRVIGHLPDLEIWRNEEAGPGPFLLRGGARHFRLDPGSTRLVDLGDPEQDRLPLAFDTDLVSLAKLAPGDFWLEQKGKRILELVNRMDEGFVVAVDRDVVSFGDRQALDLRTGRTRTLPEACPVADRHGQAWYLLCRLSDAEPAIDVAGATGPARRVLGSVEAPVGKTSSGFWRTAFVSPDGRQLLAQWSTECEVQRVYLVPTSGSPPVALAALLGRPDGDLESEAWGWTRDGAAVVTVRGEPGCAEDYPASGVYLIRDEKPSVLYPVPASKGMTAIAVWAPLLG